MSICCRVFKTFKTLGVSGFGVLMGSKLFLATSCLLVRASGYDEIIYAVGIDVAGIIRVKSNP